VGFMQEGEFHWKTLSEMQAWPHQLTFPVRSADLKSQFFPCPLSLDFLKLGLSLWMSTRQGVFATPGVKDYKIKLSFFSWNNFDTAIIQLSHPFNICTFSLANWKCNQQLLLFTFSLFCLLRQLCLMYEIYVGKLIWVADPK